MTVITTVRYQGNALTDTFNAIRVQCLALLVHTSTIVRPNAIASAEFRNKSKNTQTIKTKRKLCSARKSATDPYLVGFF